MRSSFLDCNMRNRGDVRQNGLRVAEIKRAREFELPRGIVLDLDIELPIALKFRQDLRKWRTFELEPALCPGRSVQSGRRVSLADGRHSAAADERVPFDSRLLTLAERDLRFGTGKLRTTAFCPRVGCGIRLKGPTSA